MIYKKARSSGLFFNMYTHTVIGAFKAVGGRASVIKECVEYLQNISLFRSEKDRTFSLQSEYCAFLCVRRYVISYGAVYTFDINISSVFRYVLRYGYIGENVISVASEQGMGIDMDDYVKIISCPRAVSPYISYAAQAHCLSVFI